MPRRCAPLLRHARLALAGLALLGLTACAAPPPGQDVHDPFEGFNRVMHENNKRSDRLILRPASRVYATVVPPPLAQGVDNFAGNLDQPSMVVNDVLQLQIEDAGRNFFRFLVNSTVGVFGLFDPASLIGLEARDSDFGETMAVWGIGEGAYLELPLLGPSTVRDTAGRVVDVVLNPVRLAVPTVRDRQYLRLVELTDLVGDRAENDALIEGLYDSPDSYIALRSIYLQNRRGRVSGATDAAEEDLFYDPSLDPFAIPVSR